MKKLLPIMIIALLFVVAIGLIFFGDLEENLQEAHSHYVAGEKATTITERKSAFNLALTLYTELESIHSPTFGNGKLYYNIANTYFQLEEYPRAILYYYRALDLRPRDDNVQYNLNIALSKVGSPPLRAKTVFEKIFFFHTYLSLPERLQLFFALGVLMLILCSLYIWSPFRLLKNILFIVGITSSVILLSLFTSHYLEPMEGVIIRSSALYRGPGEHYSKAIERPIRSGVKVEVLEVLKDGKWLKVVTPDEQLGYISHQSVRLI